MENNILKEKVKANVKEKIAILNIRREFDMKANKNKKIVYIITSACAVLVLCMGIIIGTNNSYFKKVYQIALEKTNTQNQEESLKNELNINKFKISAMVSLDADVKIITLKDLPEKFKFIENISLPEEYKLEESYIVCTRDNKEIDEYNILHDYVFNYTKGNNKIKIAFSEIEEPLRDYFIECGDKISKIGDAEFIISQSGEMYIVTFSYQNINFDIETTGITEDELVNLLQSIIDQIKNINNSDKIIEDKDSGANEPTNEITETNYPEYYAGRYIDNNGNNVVLLCEDKKENREYICNLLGITESKTTFKTANNSYNYLIELQNNISQKMQNKEWPFVTSSTLMEADNKIEVVVIIDKKEDIDQIKELDITGEAIEIKYNSNSISTEDLLIEAE